METTKERLIQVMKQIKQEIPDYVFLQTPKNPNNPVIVVKGDLKIKSRLDNPTIIDYSEFIDLVLIEAKAEEDRANSFKKAEVAFIKNIEIFKTTLINKIDQASNKIIQNWNQGSIMKAKLFIEEFSKEECIKGKEFIKKVEEMARYIAETNKHKKKDKDPENTFHKVLSSIQNSILQLLGTFEKTCSLNPEVVLPTGKEDSKTNSITMTAKFEKLLETPPSYGVSVDFNYMDKTYCYLTNKKFKTYSSKSCTEVHACQFDTDGLIGIVCSPYTSDILVYGKKLLQLCDYSGKILEKTQSTFHTADIRRCWFINEKNIINFHSDKIFKVLKIGPITLAASGSIDSGIGTFEKIDANKFLIGDEGGFLSLMEFDQNTIKTIKKKKIANSCIKSISIAKNNVVLATEKEVFIYNLDTDEFNLFINVKDRIIALFLSPISNHLLIINAMQSVTVYTELNKDLKAACHFKLDQKIFVAGSSIDWEKNTITTILSDGSVNFFALKELTSLTENSQFVLINCVKILEKMYKIF